MRASGDVVELHKKFGKEFQFLMVYIREAHPTDGWAMENSKIRDPRTQKERNSVASQCGTKLKFEFPIVVDDMKDTTLHQWGAWPERLFVIDEKNKVRYAGQQGPFGFWPTEKWVGEMKAPKKMFSSKGYSSTSLEEFLLEYRAMGKKKKP